ncbi:hypothetical protein ACM64Y_09150 [Novispirillum sp. DQ9]|uniref:hypothetical protein n=1 Tax=Novispirillum sp. DQ9 TaxID=3398612 RepID=UPI003C7D29C2
MLSIIVYGRNDSHWSNLPKRAALSLNCLAMVLSDPDDEILFVDYNSPDDLPTFPEAIADTLTTAARKRLRVIRVREHHHRRFAGLTPLPVIEAVSRNVGLRRMNPANRWVLHTNSDMLFVLPDGQSLSQLVAGLEEALYLLPRHEIPETLWGGLDRQDPAGALGLVRQVSASLRLNAVVECYPETRYDYSGDFQLLPAERLRAIGGFDERMLFRGECDPNIAKRLALSGLPARSLAGALAGYHCGHYRGIRGGSARPQNDFEIFFNQVTEACPAEQAADWGLAEETLEDFRLTEPRSLPTMLSALLPPPETSPEVIAYPPRHRQSLCYAPASLAPFLADLLWTLPKERGVQYIGLNPTTAHLVEQIASALGFATAGPAGVVVVDLGLDESLAPAEDDALEAALDVMAPRLAALAEVELDHLAQGHAPRLIIVINHGRALLRGPIFQDRAWLGALAETLFNLTSLPVQCRLAYGTVRHAPAPWATAEDLRKEMRRSRPVSRVEFLKAFQRLHVLALRFARDPNAIAERQEMKPAVMALARLALRVGCADLPRDTMERLCAQADAPVPGLLVPLGDRNTAAPSRLPGASDWEDENWHRWWSAYHVSKDPDDSFVRSRQEWGATQILATLSFLGGLRPGAKIIAVAPVMGRLLRLLDDQVAEVDRIDTPLFGVGRQDRDVALATAAAMRTVGYESLVPWIAALDEHLSGAGLLVMETGVRLTWGNSSWMLPAAGFASGQFAAIFEDTTGLRLEGPTDFATDPETLACWQGDNDFALPNLVREHFGALTSLAVLAWRKTTRTTAAGWAAAQARVLDLGHGGLLDLFRPSGGIVRAPDGKVRFSEEAVSRPVPLPPGHYCMLFEAWEGSGSVRIVTEDGDSVGQAVAGEKVSFLMPAQENGWPLMRISVIPSAAHLGIGRITVMPEPIS